MNNIKDMPLLPPFCPHCHKMFFWSGPATGKQTKTCNCKKGRKLFSDWLNLQSQVMSEMTDPTEAVQPEPVLEVVTPDQTEHIVEVEDGNRPS